MLMSTYNRTRLKVKIMCMHTLKDFSYNIHTIKYIGASITLYLRIFMHSFMLFDQPDAVYTVHSGYILLHVLHA